MRGRRSGVGVHGEPSAARSLRTEFHACRDGSKADSGASVWNGELYCVDEASFASPCSGPSAVCGRGASCASWGNSAPGGDEALAVQGRELREKRLRQPTGEAAAIDGRGNQVSGKCEEG